ncbi:hypothetical protein MTO96_041841 [Rhipicephalus appendiculatus]
MERRGRWVGSTVGWAGGGYGRSCHASRENGCAQMAGAELIPRVEQVEETRKSEETTSSVVRRGSLDDEQASGLAKRITS